MSGSKIMKDRAKLSARERIQAQGIPFAVGVMALWMGWGFRSKDIKLDDHGRLTHAKIVDRGKSWVYSANVNGIRVWGTCAGNYYLGQTIPVLYLPEDPSISKPVGGANDESGGYVFLGLGALFVLYALTFDFTLGRMILNKRMEEQ